MIGTSINTPTTVANAAPDSNPNNAMATATANSKKLLAPIIDAGEQIQCSNFKYFLPINQDIKKMKYV